MDLIELRQALRRGWIFGVLAAVLVAAAGMWALGPAENRFAASTTLLVTPRAERFQTISTGVLRVVLPNVLVVARSETLERTVARSVGEAASFAVETDAAFVRDSGVLTLTARSVDRNAAVAWSGGLADELADRYAHDPYLIVEVLDRATSGSIPGAAERKVDLAGVALLSLIAAVLTVFVVQRVRESSDIAARIRTGGLRVLAELAVPGRHRSSPASAAGDQARRLAMAVSSAPGVAAGARFVVVSGDTRPAVAVVDAMRAGFAEVGLAGRHRVMLGPELDDLPNLHRESHGNTMCVAVLDRSHPVDGFIRDVHAISDAEIPVLGVVVIRNRRRR